MTNLATDLARVMELLEKATPGVLEALHPAIADECLNRHWLRSDDDGILVATCQYAHDADALAAAVNFLRQHGPEIAETFKETPNG